MAIRLSVFYPSTEGATFDHDYYRDKHVPLAVKTCGYQDPLLDAYAEAGRTAGHGWTDDYNGEVQQGFSRLQMTIGKGRRCSAAMARSSENELRRSTVAIAAAPW